MATDLASAGHDVVDARDAGLRGAPDDVVYARGVADARVVVSGDTDFVLGRSTP